MRTCKCGAELYYESEQDQGICYDCQDEEISQYQRRRDWSHFHPGEAIPEDELKQPPF